ncbi:SMP-30/gluconolactonase/LRE family protein [Pseudoduganella violaceinigra]|uniref:SMP-30/gluconolactonase/LRE family protein n=1 Tax=Pseudoduganella violaceinigra TaxID=246602 RepID=UPI0003FC468E|nr:hypothetical protein [Pseudoduganella violaceinigra]
MPLRFPAACAALALVLAAASAATCAAAPASASSLPFDWYPESVAAAPDGTLYVGSWRQGAVARLRPGALEAEILVPPGSNGLANTQGVLVDADAGLLWVCSGSMGFTTVPTTPSALKSYDLATGAPRASYPMPEAGYCNDLVQDKAGNLYVTDSLHPRILRLAPGASALSVWKEDPAFSTGDQYFLNGIALDGANRLYVSAVMAVDYLLRVDIGPSGQAGPVARIAAPRKMKNVDAIRSAGPGRLVLFESNAFGNEQYGGAVTIAQIDGTRVASLAPLVAGLNDPSSGAVFGDRVYFIESKYSLLFKHKDDDAAVPRSVPFAVASRALPHPD